MTALYNKLRVCLYDAASDITKSINKKTCVYREFKIGATIFNRFNIKLHLNLIPLNTYISFIVIYFLLLQFFRFAE